MYRNNLPISSNKLIFFKVELKPLVNRNLFKSLDEPELILFTENAVDKTDGVKEYSDVQSAASNLKDKAAAHKDAFKAAQSGDHMAKQVKKEALKAVLEALNLLSSGLDYFANGSVTYIQGAGMEAQSVRPVAKRTQTQETEPPQFSKVELSKIPGEVIVEVSGAVNAKMFGFEYSEDQISWQYSEFSSRRRTSLKLPTRKDLWLRCRAIGNKHRQSEYSSVAKTFLP
jgi:hypothetical protein